MNPVDLAAARFKPIRHAREQIAKTEAALATAVARLEELRAQLPQAEARDRTALAAALVEGKREPESKAEQICTETAAQERRVEALRLAVEDAHGSPGKLRVEHRESWQRQAQRELSKAKERYEAAIAELETARGALADAATLLRWIGNGDVSEAAGDALAGGGTDRSVLAFSHTLSELRRDVQYLATRPGAAAPPEWKIDSSRVKVGALIDASRWGGD
jgi:DNA repair exonuclease SbcCD ATPase subunit